MFGSILIVVGTVLHAYVFWRASSVPFLRRGLRARTFAGIAAVPWVCFVFGRLAGHGSEGSSLAILDLLSLTWLTTLFLVSVSLIACDLVTAYGFLFRRFVPAMRGLAILVGAGLSVAACIQGMRPPAVESYEVELAGLPEELDGTVLVAMSDLHLGAVLGKDWMTERVEQVRSLRPDLVVLLGDIFEGHGQPPDEILQCVNRLSARFGVWAVPGNHESFGRSNGVSPLDAQTGVRVLRNRWSQPCRGLVLAGVEDLTVAGRNGRGADLIRQSLTARPQGATILLSHTPWQADTASVGGAGLMLCGHTHGGQVWPFGHVVEMRYPLVSGRYEVGDMTVTVCRGTGTWGPRMRLWSPGEILRVTLRAKKTLHVSVKKE